MARTERARVLFAHISPDGMPSFVANDLSTLRSKFQVTEFAYRGTKDLLRIMSLVARHDLIVSWFAWDQAFWGNLAAVLTGKRSLTIVGGFDVVSLPEINYGNLLNPGSRRRTQSAIRLATTVLAVSKSVRDDAVRLSGRQDIRVVYHGLDPARFPLGTSKRQLVLTVGAVTESNLSRKGIRTFIRSAGFLPEVSFVVAGRIDPSVLKTIGDVPPNVRFLGRLSDSDLIRLMMRAKVYVQPSAHEGFGVSLAEAMLCGCMPVVTARGAIPEVVGDVGIYVPCGDPTATAEAIRKSLASDDYAGASARDRIVKLFPLEARKSELIRAVQECLE